MFRLKPWTTAACVTAVILYGFALSHGVYELTSPTALSWHVLLRKSYSVAAFALLGFLVRRALAEQGRLGRTIATCVIGVAAYSAAIEIGQFVHGSREGLGWNAFDIACGAFGGALAVADRIVRQAAPPHT